MEFESWAPFAVVGVLAAVMAGTLEAGFRYARSLKREGEQPVQLSTMQAAILGLLGLMLGFSFSGATTRFVARQELLVSETNAIGTAYLRTGLLPAEDRDVIRGWLRDYVTERRTLQESLSPGVVAQSRAKIESLQRDIWKRATQSVQSTPGTSLAVLAPINEFIDILSQRDAAARRHLPRLVVGLLFFCAVAAVFTIGMGCGFARSRQIGTASVLTFLITALLWTIIDLDFPRVGLIQIDPTPIHELQQSLSQEW